jgi:uracil-DNA glycosylase
VITLIINLATSYYTDWNGFRNGFRNPRRKPIIITIGKLRNEFRFRAISTFGFALYGLKTTSTNIVHRSQNKYNPLPTKNYYITEIFKIIVLLNVILNTYILKYYSVMPKFNISEMFRGVDKQWVKTLTSKTLMVLLSKALDDLGKTEDDITPPPNQIFNFARVTPYNKIKVVVLGQDPYPTKGEAHGLAFSSLGSKTPSSLRNIYKCLEEQKQIDTIPTTSDLTHWAKQGVLLLNASLTTQVGKANAHAHIWKEFTDELIRYISHDDTCGPCPSLTFMLWGAYAQKKKSLINDDCVIYNWLHPSPLAQTKKNKFANCDHFAKVNALLVNEMELEPIDWNPSPIHIIYTDGACSNNGKGIFASAGYSTYFAKGPLRGTVKYGKVAPVILDGIMTYGTNQRGEGLGIIVGLESVIQSNVRTETIIVTDSNFWKDMIETYMPKWEMKGLDFKSKKNHDLTLRMYDAVKRVIEIGGLQIIHVASHDKDPNAPPEHVAGNRVADDYANKGKLSEGYNEQVEQI